MLQKAYEILQKFAGDILGVLREEAGQDSGLVEALMELLLELRQELRKQKNFALADQIRDQLAGLGVTVEDTPEGPGWKV